MIHTTAIISNNSVIGDNVEVGPYSIIHDNVIIGDNSKIGAYCEVGIDTPLAKEKKLINIMRQMNYAQVESAEFNKYLEQLNNEVNNGK